MIKKRCFQRSLIVVVVSVLRLWQNTHWQETISFDNLSRAGLGHLGKGGIVSCTTTRYRLAGLTGSSVRAGTGSTNLQLLRSSFADCQALT